MSGKKRPWAALACAALLSAAVVVVVWKLRSADRLTRATGPAPSAAIPNADPTDLKSLERRLQAAGELDDPVMRDMITDEVAEALIHFHSQPAPKPEAPVVAAAPDRPKEYDLKALRAEFDEARATKDLHLRRLGLAAVAEFMAVNDPELAAKWVEELLVAGAKDPSADAYAFTSAFAETYAPLGLDNAVEWASRLPNAALRLVAQQYIAREWAPRDIGAVEAWIAATGDATERSNIIRGVDGVFRAGNDAVSSAWAQRLAASADDGPRHSDVVVRHWAKTDLNAAIDWASSLPDPDDVERAVDGLAEAFAAKDPGAATRWVASFPDGPVKARALTLTAVYWAHFEPQAAAQWLKACGQPGVLESTAPGVYSSLLAKDPAGAEAWLDALPIRAEMRDYVRSLNAHAGAGSSR